MFVSAIETVSRYTRPIHTVSRNFDSDQVQSGAATLYFVNGDGWALTCRHVAELLLIAEQLDAKRQAYDSARKALRPSNHYQKELRAVAQDHGFARNTPYEILHRFMDCVDKMSKVDILLHPHHDVALLRFVGFTSLLCDSFPVFANAGNNLKPGMFLCRLGYPFAEFSDFTYDKQLGHTTWTDDGVHYSPWFPIEGMVTRLVADNGAIGGFEMSTPGLRGQSGGPVFDADGRIWGMQSATWHLDLDFDVNMDVLRNGTKQHVSESALLHVGRCVHVNILKEFMKQHGVEFQEG